MKKHFFPLAVLAILLTTLVISCKKDDNSNSSPSTTSIITAGSWRVSYYHENADDHTADFSGYTFKFNSNGTMTATNSAGTTNGTWSNDDSKNEMHMDLGSIDPLKSLTKGWLIISKSNTELKLQDDNTSSVEEVHFTKI